MAEQVGRAESSWPSTIKKLSCHLRPAIRKLAPTEAAQLPHLLPTRCPGRRWWSCRLPPLPLMQCPHPPLPVDLLAAAVFPLLDHESVLCALQACRTWRAAGTTCDLWERLFCARGWLNPQQQQ